MKVTICGSINFAEEMLRIRDELERMGHEVFIPNSIKDFSIKNDGDARRFKANRERYIGELKPRYTMDHFKLVEKSDAILVVNMEKNGIDNYIGGATFAEVMLAFYLGKKIFLLNPVPSDSRLAVMRDEIESVKPFVLNGDLEKIK